jgi:hypothetical protein
LPISNWRGSDEEESLPILKTTTGNERPIGNRQLAIKNV